MHFGKDDMPALWTIVTANFFDSNLLYLLINLFILNESAKKMEHIWLTRDMLKLFIFTGFFCGCQHLILQYCMFKMSKNSDYLDWPYSNVSTLTLCVIMGLRQHFYDQSYDSGIAFLQGNLKLSLRHAPAVFVLSCFLLAFLLESAYPLHLPLACYCSWFYLRFLMRSLGCSQLGSPDNDAFALGSFLPQKQQQQMQPWFDSVYSCFHCRGLFSRFRQVIRPQLHNENKDQRMQALQKLDKELEKKRKGPGKDREEDEEALKDIEVCIQDELKAEAAS